jgi:prolyl 4-hydroxylase
MIKVTVFEDMGHLNYQPSNLPEYITGQINNSVESNMKLHDGYGYRFYNLKPHIPKVYVVGEYEIHYKLNYRKEYNNRKISVKTVPGAHSLMVLDNLLSRDECKELIQIANGVKNDKMGNQAWHNADTGGDYRRVVMIDNDLAIKFWGRIRSFLPDTYRGYKLLYLNHYFRYSRYKPGGEFTIHCDGQKQDYDHMELTNGYMGHTLFTLNIFLNDKESDIPLNKGGHTDFFNEVDGHLEPRYSVEPKAGRAALFWYDQWHQGNVVEDGTKYLLRTDVVGVKSEYLN